jgi:ankyrin repeat protein
MTPLHRAIGKDQKEAVELLLQCGANKEAIDKLGRTPLLAALHLGFRGPAEVLLKNGASILAVMPTTLATALHIAVATASFTTAFTRQLITLGHPVDARDKNGETPLMVCAKSVNSSDSQLDSLLAYSLTRLLAYSLLEPQLTLAQRRGRRRCIWRAITLATPVPSS